MSDGLDFQEGWSKNHLSCLLGVGLRMGLLWMKRGVRKTWLAVRKLLLLLLCYFSSYIYSFISQKYTRFASYRTYWFSSTCYICS